MVDFVSTSGSERRLVLSQPVSHTLCSEKGVGVDEKPPEAKGRLSSQGLLLVWEP